MNTIAPRGALLERLVARSADVVESNQDPDGAARVLLADMLACVGASPVEPKSRFANHACDFSNDGTCGRAAALALRAHSRDLDDIFWPTRTHIGSIVWPVTLALGAEVRARGEDILRAARMGYQVAGETALLLGPAHGSKWHATATAGVVGSAAAAAVLLRADRGTTIHACGHAAAMAGGVGQSVAEHSATTAFHRASAAATGILAARFACAGAVPPARVLEGPYGLLGLLAPGSAALADSPIDVLAATSVRIFPVNGFSQGAVALTAELRRRFDEATGVCTSPAAVPRSIAVEVSPVVAKATAGEVGGDWWDTRGAVAAAWMSGDGFRLERTPASRRLRPVVQMLTASQDIGVTRVAVDVPDGEMSAELTQPPGTYPYDPDSLQLLQRKWAELGAANPISRAGGILERGIEAAELDALLCEPVAAQQARP